MAADSGPKPLYDLVHRHNGFLVNPLQWTSRHEMLAVNPYPVNKRRALVNILFGKEREFARYR
ncbi:hypothetical protein N7478_001180 [Penicillium angulare]|uniref:uncharacterized protein n=1 Tax=Penicillium angulare TaxID=116970 RepID=UPI00254200E9|nr:uncharacterized protein N7478_001180 [Penicillium angulare]KAJ5291929.1 hypothetical protein N7478_001180 [Penicillium angulare]